MFEIYSTKAQSTLCIKEKNTEIRMEHITVSWVIIPPVVSIERQPTAQENYQNLPNTVCHSKTVWKCAKCTLHRYPRFPSNRKTRHKYPSTTFHKLLYSSFVPNAFVFLFSPMFAEEVARYTEITCTQMVDRLHCLRSKWTKPRV